MILRAEAGAKVNLYLKVLGRRADGYHELDSLMARLDLADGISLSISGEPGGDCLEAVSYLKYSLPPGFSGPDNIILKALAAYRQATGWPEGRVAVRVEKRIPLGAGLGGGSADAAAVLKLLNEACPRPLAAEHLAGLGLSLGADVPFCLSGRTMARAGGVGEELRAAPDIYRAWGGRKITLVNPGLFVSTAQVFQKLGLTNGAANNNLGPKQFPAPQRGTTPPQVNSDSICAAGQGLDSPFVCPGENDLFAPALLAVPELSAVAEALAATEAEAWGMSGSGATFWLYKPRKELDGSNDAWWVRDAFILK